MEERREHLRVGPTRGVEVDDLLVGEEHREQVPTALDAVGDPGRGQRLGDLALDLGGDPVDVLVDLGGGAAQRGQTRGRGQRVTGQRARLVDRAVRGQTVHDVGPTAEGRGRQATAHDLAEGHQVGRHALQTEPARGADPEPGEDLVEDQQGAVGVRDLL